MGLSSVTLPPTKLEGFGSQHQVGGADNQAGELWERDQVKAVADVKRPRCDGSTHPGATRKLDPD